MKITGTATAGLLLALAANTAFAQSTPAVDRLVQSAKALAGDDWSGVFQSRCVPTIANDQRIVPTVNPENYPTSTVPTPPGQTSPPQNWYSPPAKIGDNLYFLGTRHHSTYALVSSQGDIILIDGNFEYATEPEIHEGLLKLGLDPSKVRYALYSHAHADHDGGAHLTERAFPGVTIVYGEGDWPAVLARSGPHATRFGPQNDGTDGRVIQVGDVSVQIVTTPGHTPGTMSYLFEFRDKGESLRVAYQGGTAFSFTDQNPAYYDQFLASTRKFTQLAAAYGANTLMSNHTTFDMAYTKSHTALALRALHGDDKRHSNQFYSPSKAPTKPDGIRTLVSNPFYVGQRRVLNYLGTYELCTMAAKLRATGTL